MRVELNFVCSVAGTAGKLMPPAVKSNPATVVSGAVHIQKHGKKEFQQFYIMLADGKMTTKLTEDSGVVGIAALFACKCSEPKSKRKGFPHAFRVDLKTADSLDETKYVMAVQNAELKMQWMTCECAVLHVTILVSCTLA